MSAPDARGSRSASLFAAARDDAPDRAQRDAMLHKIALTTSVAAGAVAAASLAPAANAAGAGSVAAGGAGTALVVKLVGAGIVLGVIATGSVVALQSSRGIDAPITRAPAPHVADRAASGAKLGSTVVRQRDPATIAEDDDDDDDASPVLGPSRTATLAPSARVEPARVDSAREAAPSDLAEEARIVTAARRALVAGDAARALAIVQTTRKLSARALEPEELGLEARALQALGRTDDALATELVLKRRYPDSALAR